MEEYRVEPVTQTAFDIICGYVVEPHHAKDLIADLERAGYVVALVEPQGN